MCGRYLLKRPPHEVVERFMNKTEAPPNFGPRYNVAPSDPMPVVRLNPKTRERSVDLLRWGLIPSWTKDAAGGTKPINARSETIRSSGMFKEAFAERRALIPADGFYEWKKSGTEKQPHGIGLADGSMFAFAGLWENWKSPASGEWTRTYTIVTTSANDLLRPLHERMPVILSPDAYGLWLGETDAAMDELEGLLRPFPAENMAIWPVSKAVGSVRNDYAELAEPVAI